jgi:hypothetical protein
MAGLIHTVLGAAILPVLLAQADADGEQSGIEYATVAEARKALLAKPSIESKIEDGWLIVFESRAVTWTFTPESYEAYPAVAKRILVQDTEGNIFIRTFINCEASKEPCDRLAEGYNRLDEELKKELHGKKGKSEP